VDGCPEERKHGKDTEIPYSDLFDKVQNQQVLDASIQGNELRVT